MSARRAPDNVYLCYTPQNYFKALYLAHGRYERGETSLVLALFFAGREDPSFFRTDDVYWAEVELRLHRNDYVRILPGDRARPIAYVKKATTKAMWKVVRWLGKAAERRAILEGVRDAKRVHLFLESTYFSSHVLKHRTCTLVEEGLTSYKPYLSRVGRGARKRFAGEHPNVDEVLLQRPERASERVRPKVKPLRLDYGELPAQARRVLLRLFGLDSFVREPRNALVIGQAWSQSIVGDAAMLERYARVVGRLHALGYVVYVKPHPREDVAAYRALGCRVLNAKMPLEAFALRDEPIAFDLAVSILESSVAMSPQLADRLVCFLPGETLVEEFTREQMGELDRVLEAWSAAPAEELAGPRLLA